MDETPSLRQTAIDELELRVFETTGSVLMARNAGIDVRHALSLRDGFGEPLFHDRDFSSIRIENFHLYWAVNHDGQQLEYVRYLGPGPDRIGLTGTDVPISTQVDRAIGKEQT